LIYHGSTTEVRFPDINYGRVKLDFGKGFYATTMQAQAEKWARRKSKMTASNPVVSVYEFSPIDLNILYFDGYTEEWLDFVVKNRSEAFITHSYDGIYGNIANDDVATVVNDYVRLLRKGRISETGKLFYLEQLQYSEPNNQYCITSKKGIDAIGFIDSYIMEG
jgi:hypothetical protein